MRDGGHGGGRTRSWLGRATLALALALSFGATTACQTVAVTGRSQFNIYSLSDDKQLGAQAYAEAMGSAKRVTSGPQYEQVKRVVERLIPVVDDPGFEWEFNVVEDPKTVNAWCMPGGKIAVYTGILPVTEDDAGLAVVLGHEIGHAIARHGTERASAQGLSEVGLAVLAASSEDVAQYHQEILMLANVFAFMPWGRNHELEADRIGLIYMARAGYDPRSAVAFWGRMAQLSGGSAPPEFLSTHPSDEHRIREIERFMPDALAAWQKATGRPAGGP